MDNNRGIAYPPEELIAYKALQEARISRERQGLFIPVGWLFELVIHQSPIFQTGQRIRLAKLNLILGSNGTGKTALTEWIAGFFAPDYLKRWQRSGPKLIDLRLTFLNPSSHELRVQFGPNELLYHVDGKEAAFIGMPLTIVRLRSITLRDEEDDEDALSRILSLPRQIVRNLFKEIEKFRYSRVRNLHYRKDEETGLMRLHADVEGTVPGLEMRALSGRETERIFIELAAAAARVAGQHAPTVLILDGGANIIFEGFFDFYSHHFLDPDNHFQTLLCLPTTDLDVKSLHWNGWEVIQTVGSQPDVSIRQEATVSQ